jgi:hypothetical protein
MRCITPQRIHGPLAYVRLTMLQKLVCGFLEPRTLKVPYAVSYANSQFNINLCVEFFVPLRVGHCLLPK